MLNQVNDCDTTLYPLMVTMVATSRSSKWLWRPFTHQWLLWLVMVVKSFCTVLRLWLHWLLLADWTLTLRQTTWQVETVRSSNWTAPTETNSLKRSVHVISCIVSVTALKTSPSTIVCVFDEECCPQLALTQTLECNHCTIMWKYWRLLQFYCKQCAGSDK